MRTLILSIMMIGVGFLASGQDRQKKGSESNPRATTSTREQSPARQDAKDISRSKAEKKDLKDRKRSSPSKDEGSKAGKDRPANETERRAAEAESWDNGRMQDAGKAVGPDHRNVFDNVRSGLNNGSVGSFSDMLGPRVSIDLRGGESGYFSSNQAYYVLERYMQANRISDLTFSTMEESAGVPFATGRTTIVKKGMKENAQVYVSLTQVGGRWVISQIKIY